MAESSGKEGSSTRTNSKKGSSNPLTKLLFRRKSSRTKGDDSEREPSVTGAEEQNDPGLLEQTKEVFEKTLGEVFQEENETLVEQTNIITSRATEAKESSSEPIKEETKHDLLGKFKDRFDEAKGELDKAKEGLKEGFDKAKEEFKAIIHEDKKPSTQSVDEVKAPSLAQRLKEEVVAIQSTFAEKKDETGHEEKKENEESKEDNCIASLAQGLQHLCAPWSSRKQD